MSAVAEEAEVLSQVEARTGRQAIFSYNSAGERIVVGTVRYRDYEGNRAVRHLILESEMSGREHPLGAASKSFLTVSHAEVLEPFLAAGYEPRNIMHARGGASMIAILGHPGHTFDDHITWDKELLPNWNADGSGMELSVRVRSDLRRGHGVVATAGFFRLVCTNGLVAKVLGLGQLVTNHRIFTPTQVEAFVGNTPIRPEDMPQTNSTLIDDVLEFLNTRESSELPRLVRGPVQKIQSDSNQATFKALTDGLEAIRDKTNTFSRLDLINAQTNMAMATRSPWSIYRETDPMSVALTNLVELAGVKRGIKTFES